MRADRVVGVLLGAAAGDALGAPYEFGPAGELSRVGREMQGGGTFGWKPGEWTDDTQMSLHIAASLLEHEGIDEADLWSRFRRWSRHAADVGVQTRRVLGSGKPWQTAASDDFASGARSAGNGSLMRTSTAALFFAGRRPQESADAARRISALTHGDPLAGECCVVLHELIRVGLSGADPIEHLGQALELVLPEHRAFLEQWLRSSWEPDPRDNNGVCWVTLAQAVWAVRTHATFADALRSVVDLGGDTDTVACVTGALAGAAFGVQAIPSAWTSVLNGLVPGDDEAIARDRESLQTLALRLVGWTPKPLARLGPGQPVIEIAPHLFATDLVGATRATGYAVVSLCRTAELLDPARQIWLIDSEDPDDNPHLDIVVADVISEIEQLRVEGRDVLVHCHRGESRTGLVVQAWFQMVQGLSHGEALNRTLALSSRFVPWNDRFKAYLMQLPPAPTAEYRTSSGDLVTVQTPIDFGTDMPHGSYAENPIAWLDWAGEYNAYELLASDPLRVLQPMIDEFWATGSVPEWCGEHLLRGWLFWLYRDVHWNYDALDEGSPGRAEWEAAVAALRVRLEHRAAEAGE